MMDPHPAPSRLDRAFDSPEAKRRYVRRLFETIAVRYDLITRLLSFGFDQGWKRRLVRLSGAGPGMQVLDLACGTGDIAIGAARCGARVLGLDLAHRMVFLARGKAGAGPISWIVGDMTDLPVPDSGVDVVTTGYGLRNVPDLRRALVEIHRVLRSGGVFCSLDFDRPANPVVRAVYLGYLWTIGTALGRILHGNPDAYRYIPASIRRYPGAAGVVAMLREAGFSEARSIPVLGGLMAIHVARR